MPKEIRKNIRIPSGMCEYITILAKCLNVSENDVIKMIIFNDMKTSKYFTISREGNE